MYICTCFKLKTHILILIFKIMKAEEPPYFFICFSLRQLMYKN